MSWLDILNQCLDILLPAVASVIAIILGVVGNKIKKTYNEKVQDETVQTVVDSVVKWAQQVYKELDGPEKLQKALTQASTILNEKGITISELELNMLIESAVYGLKQGITNTDQETIENNTVIEELPEATEQEEISKK